MSASLRDGTSQAGRVLPELDPDHARVDERTSADLLAFAREYAGELKYFAPEDPDEAQGTWSGFIGEDGAQPRPHLALFLAFLELLGHTRAQLNTLTRRHLEFFYRDVLRMVRKRAVPDKVHVLLELDDRTRELLLPAGTALRAGKDSLGRELTYRTERDVVANHVEVAHVSSVRTQIRTTGLREASPQYAGSGNKADAFVSMLRIALGQPDPGDPLPVPVYPGVPPARSQPNEPDPQVSFDVLKQANDLIGMVERALGMPLLGDLRSLMQLKALRQENDSRDWTQINALLQKAGEAREPGFKLEPQDPAAFTANLQKALGLAPAEFARLYDGLPEVKSIEEAYAVHLKRSDVQDFIRNRLRLSLEDFRTLMQAKTLMDNQWSEIDRLLEAAGKRKDPAFQYGQRASRDFNAKLAAVAALAPKFEFPGGIDAFYGAFTAIQRYFHMPAESFRYIMSVAAQEDADEAAWSRVYDIAAAAHRDMVQARRRAGLLAPGAPDPAPEKREWRNIYPVADARKAAPSAPARDAGALARWKTFGAGEQELRDPQPVPPAALGWAMASPLLALREGARTIELSLGFSADAPDFDLAANPFQVELSTAKGWLEPQSPTIAWATAGLEDPRARGAAGSPRLRTLVLNLAFPESQPALEPLTREVHGIDTPAPVLRLMLRPVWQKESKCYVTPAYNILRKLSLVRARLVVTAAGIAGLSIANDQATLDAKKPFEPFGTQPAAGSRFYLGHPEVVGKKLDKLAFNIVWMGAPPSFAEHYKNYPGNLGNASFKAKVSLSEGRVLKDFPAPLALFDANSTERAKPSLTPPADQGSPERALSTPADVTEWSRYLIWELLAPDFQHSAYPTVALQKSLQMAAAVSRQEKPSAADYQVNPPYTPKIKSLSLDYTASAELVLDAAPAAGAVRVFHVHPFGYSELEPDGSLRGSPFLPQYDFEGELYIGLRNVTAPQNVSLLFQIAEGTADPGLEAAPVQWSYLSGNRWLTLHDGSLRADGTRGLINSGIVELTLKPARPATLLPGDLYWIRAAIARAADSVCDLVEIHPNAVCAIFADAGNAPDHLAEPLPAGRITGPAQPVPGLARIRQPYTSFGGKMAEQDTSFYVRVSERLRHKERALTAWDYERLVLEKFPQIYKVKCLRADPRELPYEPGSIELVVIPDIRNRLPFNPFEPKAPADLIRDIEAFLRDKTPAFALVKVKNAHYVPVKVRCGVRFMPGTDEGFCRRRLNEELNRFLSPWAYEEGADLVIGGSVYANSIINFIDRRDYVDYVFEFKLFTSEDGGRTFNPVKPADEGYRAGTGRRDGVLVAAREHEFDVISQADYRAEGFAGVNYMRIELDFKVS